MRQINLLVSVCAVLAIAGCNKNAKSTQTPGQQPAAESTDAQAAADGGGFAPNDDPTTLPPLRCSGSEPDWSFEVTPGGKLYWTPMSGEAVTIDASSAPAGENLWTVSTTDQAPLKNLQISKESCKDTMSDDAFSHTANFVNAEGQEVKGCCNPL